MSDRNSPDWEKRLKDLEAEINAETSPVRPFNPNEEAEGIFTRAATWYQGLATPTKVGVTIVGVIVGLSILNSILKLVTSVIVLGIAGIIIYGLYRALIKDKYKP
ncbi:hypothetical protein [Crocosphaera sp. XPORK-15E]|uniref:hypothetical protein n=1 Tax=Crocosphaera sp. XPORK-15E TaxID=3110247 RepID=UPI002B1FF705|nr:hypothetical protein [Crocosphaera sp. XPORK-15E]MEA5535154.1 hypothetical protein [Crocosphaera sp. XPORK-15E]